MRTVTGLAKADSKKALDALYPTRPSKQTRFSRLIQQLMAAVTIAAGIVTTNFANLLTLGNGSLPNYASGATYDFDSEQIVISQSNTVPNIATNPNLRLFAFIFNITKNQGVSSTSSVAMLASNVWNIPTAPGWSGLDQYGIYVGYTDMISGNSTLAYKATKTT